MDLEQSVVAKGTQACAAELSSQHPSHSHVLGKKEKKGKIKKLRKASETGGVNTVAKLTECRVFDVPVSPFVQWNLSSTDSSSARPMSQVQATIMCLLNALSTTPPGGALGMRNYSDPSLRLDAFDIRNKASLHQIVLLTLADCPAEMLDGSWVPRGDGFFQRCQSPLPVRLSDVSSHPVDVLDALLLASPKGAVAGHSKAQQQAQQQGQQQDQKKSYRGGKRPRLDVVQSPDAKKPKGPAAAGNITAEEDQPPPMDEQTVWREALSYVLSLNKMRLLEYPLVSRDAKTKRPDKTAAWKAANAAVDGLIGRVRANDRLVLPPLNEAKDVIELLPTLPGLSPGFVQTLPGGHNRHCERMVAVDCEMVTTSEGKLELARVTVVSHRRQVLLDELVVPYNEVMDYQTRYSGITEELLRPVSSRLEQVQVALLYLIDQQTVVVGHSLENDLRALKLVHEKCFDTAVVFSSPRGPPYKPALRHLSQEYLGRTIQDSADGHSSEQVIERLTMLPGTHIDRLLPLFSRCHC